MADLKRTIYPHNDHPSAEGRVQDKDSSPAKDRRSANCTTQPRWRGSPSTNHSSSQKTRLSDLSYGIKMWTYHSFVLSQIMRLTDRRADRQTDRILIARPRLHSTQRGKNCVPASQGARTRQFQLSRLKFNVHCH